MSGEAQDNQSFCLSDQGVLTNDFLKLSRAAMMELGPVSQTLAAVLYIAKDDGMFATIKNLSIMACLKEKTCKRHLEILVDQGWLKHCGRKNRRTVTYKPTRKTIESQSPFVILPRWICSSLNTWGERAVFALIASRHTLIEAVEGKDHGEAYDREMISITFLAEKAHITNKTAIKARRSLKELKFIVVESGYKTDCRQPDSIYLNNDLEIPPEALLPPRLGNVKMSLQEDDPSSLNDNPVVKKCPLGWCKNVPSAV